MVCIVICTKRFPGPRMFGMDRMLAIFYVIAEMQTNINADVLSQVSTLVSLGLLAQVQLLILYIKVVLIFMNIRAKQL